jgi:hypothetical protein
VQYCLLNLHEDITNIINEAITMINMKYEDIAWDQVANKQARGINDYDLGEIQEVSTEYVMTLKGHSDRKIFQLPKRLAKSFDGNIVTFQLSESESNLFLVVDKELVDERNPPVIDETLESSKKQDKLQINDTQVPIEEAKKIEMGLVHEELVIEQKRLSKPMEIDERHTDPSTEIKIPLKSEETAVNEG